MILQKSVYTMGDQEGTLKIEFDGITMKTNLILTGFGATFGTLRFNEKSFLILCWVFQHIGIVNLLRLSMLIVRVFILVIKI